jgi:ABC-type sugar transport system substrate-binding protein
MAGAGSLILAAEPAWARTAAPERIALPAELPYVLKGAVVRLYAPQTYQWGYRSIEIRADKVILKKDPATAVIYSPLLLVDKSNVDQTEQDRKRWLWQ